MGAGSVAPPGGEERKPKWLYDPGETPKRKHGWSKNQAGFARLGDQLVAKCPKNLTNEQAQQLLDDGIPDDGARGDARCPRRIYNVHDGVLYRAVPTCAGVSYHGFPELPSEFERLEESLRARIWERARSAGQERALKKWLTQVW
jgi:hypothetical protein